MTKPMRVVVLASALLMIAGIASAEECVSAMLMWNPVYQEYRCIDDPIVPDCLNCNYYCNSNGVCTECPPREAECNKG